MTGQCAFQPPAAAEGRQQSTLLLVFSALMVAGLGVFIFMDLRQAQAETRRLYQESISALHLIGELQYQTQEARRSMIYAVTTTDANLQVQYADASRVADARVAERLAAHRRLPQSPQLLDTLVRFERDWNEYLVIRDEMIADMLEGSARAAFDRDQREGIPAFHRVHDDLQAIEGAIRERAQRQTHQMNALFRQTLLKLGAVLAVTLTLAVFAGTAMQKGRMFRAVQASEERLRQVIGSINEGMFVLCARGRVNLWNDAAERSVGRTRAEVYNQPLFDAFPSWKDTPLDTAATVALRESRPAFLPEIYLHPGQPERVCEARVFPFEGGVTVFFNEITERKQAQKQLAESEHRLRLILEAQPECVKLVAEDGTILDMNPAGLRMVEAEEREQVFGRSVYDVILPEYHATFRSMNQAVFHGESRMAEFEILGLRGTRRWMETHACPLRNAAGDIFAQLAVTRDITARRQAEIELARMQNDLRDASRRAGMAEVATGVLHNVGNVLNSVNVSATLAIDKIKKSRAPSLARVVTALREHEGDLGAFVSSDSQGKQLPTYLARLSEHLLADQEVTLRELDALRKNIEHIKEIVAMQQSYAKVSGVIETVRVRDLIEDALQLNAEALTRHEVQVTRQYDAEPTLKVDKHKVLQILVNLIRNAKYACDESGRADKRLTVQVSNGDGRVKIAVIDNGIGIPSENLTRIFNHGFTTRKDGHGFGLHSGALAAKEMGGALTVHSDGPGRGATFVVELPPQAPKQLEW